LKEVVGRVLHDGSYLEVEAFNLKVPVEELKLQLRRMYPGGCKNSQYKAVLTTSSRNVEHVPKEELKKLQIVPKPSRKRVPAQTPVPTQTPTPAPAPMPISAQTPALTPAPEAADEPDPMELLLRKKEELQQELADCDARYESANSVLQIRTDALTSANSVLQKAQAAVEKAKADKAEAETAVKQAWTALKQAQTEVQQVESEIQDLNTRTVYLVDPFYSGELPKYGTFLSTVEMEGVRREIVPAEYMPKASLEGVLLFDYVPDYKKARVFCGLVQQFELEEKQYSLLVTDENVQSLLHMYI
jgi:hypothetical protein